MELTELGRLLDRIDDAAAGDSNDAEIEALRDALECAVGALIEHGFEIPRSELDISDGIPDRLEYLRGEIRAERISYGEIAELQGLADHIEPGDFELLAWVATDEEV